MCNKAVKEDLSDCTGQQRILCSDGGQMFGKLQEGRISLLIRTHCFECIIRYRMLEISVLRQYSEQHFHYICAEKRERTNQPTVASRSKTVFNFNGAAKFGMIYLILLYWEL